MKVLLVLDCFYPNIDGPINCIENIARAGNKLNHEIELLVPNYPENREIEGIKIHRCKSMKAVEGYRNALPFFDRSIKKLIKNGGYDIVHAHSPFMLGRFAIKYAKKYNIPTVMTIHTKYRSDFERTLKSKLLINFMTRFILKPFNKCQQITAVSAGAGKTLLSYGCKNDNIIVVRNGTDMKPTKIEKELLNEIKQTYKLNKNFVFLFVGRIVENKNIQFSLEALRKLKEKGYSNFKFLIVGAGPYTANLQKLIEDYNLTDNVIFTGKIMDRKYLAGIYACADLFLFPSDFDTFGLVAMEAGTNGVPSVMFENSCASEIVTHESNGFILSRNTDTWAEYIGKLMDNPKELQKVKSNAHTLNVSWEEITKEYINVYENLIKDTQG